MSKLSDSIKKMLNGLAYQDAGDYLSTSEKMQLIGCAKKTGERPLTMSRKPVGKPTTKRVALICDGRELDAPLNYAIDACQRHDAQIDLLIHDAADTQSISAIGKQIQKAGLNCQRIQLGTNVIENIVDYIDNYPSLLFLVAVPDDAAAKTIIEEIIPKRRGQNLVPLVLIEDRLSSLPAKQSAA